MHKISIRPIGQCLRSYTAPSHTLRCSWGASRQFHASTALAIVKPYLLADIGEGITECQIIQWFVEPGATVEQFDKICEVQSDKATVEITSRFDGVIKKRYYEADDMAKVGKPLVDIDITGELSPEDKALIKDPDQLSPVGETSQKETKPAESTPSSATTQEKTSSNQEYRSSGKHATLATPAVRHLIKARNLDITRIKGTGKDGRVLKEDVQKHTSGSHDSPSSSPITTSPPLSYTPLAEDNPLPLTPIQSQMFKTMTRSLSIPHFLYTDTVAFTSLTALRSKLNAAAAKSHSPKLSSLPFIIKAVSLALESFPLLNAHLDTSGVKPQLIQKAQHNIGVAIDSPTGLLVPVVRNVQAHSVTSLAAEVARLSELARTGRLSSADLSGATFTVSNIGSIGGTAVAPVIVTPQVGILGVGRSRVVPAFGDGGELVRREECVFSWSADHRVIDGAMAARCAELVRGYLEGVETMLVRMR